MLRRHPQLDFLEGPRRKKYKYGALAFIPKFRVYNIQALEALLKTMYEGKHENGSERGMKLDHLKVRNKNYRDKFMQGAEGADLERK